MEPKDKIEELEMENMKLKEELLEAQAKIKKVEVSAWADRLQPQISKYDPV